MNEFKCMACGSLLILSPKIKTHKDLDNKELDFAVSLIFICPACSGEMKREVQK